MFVDSHCHLDFPEFAGEHDALLARMAENGVTHALCVSVRLEDLAGVLALAEAHPRFHASVGVHPDSADCREPTVDELVELASHPKVIAIGETGLDYYRLRGDLEWQRERFRVHVRAARQCRKPLIVHTRAAAEDTLRVMREERAGEVGGVMHCFTEDWPVAQGALELGFLISFSGIVTFRNARALKDVAARVPLDRMLVETDAPYLAPVPHRGRRNEPAWVVHVAEEIARLHATSREAVGRATSSNYFRLFAIAKPGEETA